jgi:predicted ATPase
LHARIANFLEGEFAEIADNQPELLARHRTEARQADDAVRLWAKAAELSLKRSALVEAMAQLTHALELIATLPSTPALRREEIRLQVALINPLFYVKGPAAPETKIAVERARSLIEHAEALGEPPEDPLLLFLVLNGLWAASFVAMKGDALRELALQYMSVAEKNGSKTPLMYGHRTMGISLTVLGDIAEGRAHLDRTIELYDPTAHRSLATRFGQDVGVAVLSFRALARWLLGFPEAALADVDRALNDARETGHHGTLMYGLTITARTLFECGYHARATSQLDEVISLADQTGASLWKAAGTTLRGCVFALAGPASNAVEIISDGLAAWRSTGSALFVPFYCSSLATAHARLGQFDHAAHWVGEAITVLKINKENWYEAELSRTAGEIAFNTPGKNAVSAEAHFHWALEVARQQQTKSWELRGAMSLARLWRDQGKVREARELLAPVYGWFTEGFDTRDLKEAKALLGELAA